LKDRPAFTLEEQLKIFKAGAGGKSDAAKWSDQTAEFMKSYVSDKFLLMIANDPKLKAPPRTRAIDGSDRWRAHPRGVRATLQWQPETGMIKNGADRRNWRALVVRWRLVGWRTSHGHRLRPSGVQRRDSNQRHF
jgi:hypothetical protein